MTPSRCPRCDSPLADGGLEGQCPRCLGALAFGGFDGGETPARGSGDYEFLRELGRGGIGVVYEAHQRSLNRRVAVKMLLLRCGSAEGGEARFRAEAEAAARLRHPGIVTVHDVGELEGHPFIAMELVAGPSLADLVRTQPIGPARAARYVRLIAEAIAHAHRHGVLHRDLKPSNVLLDETDHPRVTDFGLAKLLDTQSDLTRTGDLLGSPNYLPPEQVAGGKATVAGDVYALGAILYQLLTARPPFVADTVAATLRQVLHAEPVPPRHLNPTVPRDLETLCLKCLRKEPRARYASAVDLATDLARFEAGEPVRARPVSRAERLTRWARRNPALGAMTLTLAATAVLGVVSVLAQWRQAESNRRVLARHLYAADVAAAAAAWKEGNLGRARSLLRPHAPGGSGLAGTLSPREAWDTRRDGRPAGDKGTDSGTDAAIGMRAGTDAAAEFTWRWLWRQCRGDERGTLGTHPWIVTCVAVSPDGQWAASGSQEPPDGRGECLKVWRLGTSLSVSSPASVASRVFNDARTIWSVAFTADSRILVTGGTDGVCFRDVATGERLPGYPDLPGQEIALAGHVLVASPNHPFFDAAQPEPLWWMDLTTREARRLPLRGLHPALSPEGQRLAVLDGERNLRLFDLASGRGLGVVATNHLVFRLRFSPDGTRLAAAGQMTAAKVWPLEAPGTAPQVFRSPHNVWDAAFTPDGTTLVTATSHQQLQVWDLATANLRSVLAGHDNEVWTVAVTPDGTGIVSGGKDRSVRLWSLAGKDGVPAVPLGRHVPPRFSADGSRLLTFIPASGEGTASVWDLPPATDGPPGRPRSVGTMAGEPCGFAPDGVHLLFLRGEGPAIEWRDPGTGRLARRIALEGAPAELRLAEVVVAGDGRTLVCPGDHGAWGRWSTEDGRRLHPWRDTGVAGGIGGEPGRSRSRLVRGAAASRTGRWLALGPWGTGAAVLVDMETGESSWLRGHQDDVAALAFADDERWLATGSVDGTIRLWEVPGGREVAVLPGHLESVEAVAFSADGRTLASVSPGVDVTFWHLPTRRELARWPHPEAGRHLAFSPDGRWLALGATAGNLETDTDRVELWNADFPGR